MRRAIASALLGDEASAKTSILAARRELDRGDHDSDPQWAAFVTPTEVMAHEADASLTLGRPEQAAVMYHEVLADTGLSARNGTFYRAKLVRTLSAVGDHAQSLSEGMAVLLALEGAVKSARALNHLRPVRQWAERDSEFATRFDALASVS
jgi:hypothetical protein